MWESQHIHTLNENVGKWENIVLGLKNFSKMKISLIRIFFSIDLYKKRIIKMSQKWLYTILGINVVIFAHFLKENVGKYGNTVLDYKKCSKMKISFIWIFFSIDLYKKSIIKMFQKWLYTVLDMNVLIFSHFLK